VDRSRPILLGKKCQAVLEACGAAEYLQRTVCECDLSQEVLSEIRRQAGLQRVTSSRLTDFSIDGLETTLDQIALANEGWETKAIQLWDCLQDAIRHYREGFLFGEYRWSYSHENQTKPIPAGFVRMLRAVTWMPGKDGKPKKPSQICFTELPETFQRDANAAFVGLLEFKPDEIRQLAEKTGIDAAIWEFIREHGLSAEELRNRLGIGIEGDNGDGEEEQDTTGDGKNATGDNGAADATENIEDEESQFSTDLTNKADDEEGESSDEKADDGDQVDDRQGEARGRGGDGRGNQTGHGGGGSRRSGSGDSGKDSTHGEQGSSIGEGEKGARGHTATDREGIINRILRQLEELTSTGVMPANETTHEEPPKRAFQSDQRFREAVREYERKRGRTAHLKSGTEEGHDIDSFIREKGSLGRKLLRRIEVKGKGVAWTDEEIVEMSCRQYADASKCEVEAGVTRAPDFDYWLYVVEDDGTGKLNVLPIRNPAKRAAHYEFRAGTWRHLAAKEEETTPD
jgi:Domain of unknown function (DUF3883)